MMKLFINGEAKTIEDSPSLRDVLERFHINPDTVVVEHNKTVVARDDLRSVPVREGDQIEIVQFVGGGKEEQGSQPEPEEKPKKSKPKKKKVSRAKGPKNLVIVESPAKARTINKFLGSDYQVEASMGHVRDLPRSKMGVDIEKDFEPHYIIIRKAMKQVKHLKKQAKNKSHIYLAPDPDREGEAISWHLDHIFKEDNGEVAVHRVVFNEITKDAVLEAFHHPRQIQMNLVDAQQARRILDRVVGYELSPLLWKKVGKGLSAGRVQSVALRLIVEREREIKNFVPQEYWSLEARLSPEKEAEKIFLAKLDRIGKEKAGLKNKEQTEKAKTALKDAKFKVEKVDKRERSRKPQAPFTTSKLQQESYNRLGFPAAKTMKIAQSLYEGVEIGEAGSVGLITYMRTDSVNIAVSAQQEAADYIKTKFGTQYAPKKPPAYRSKKGAQEAHEAVRPTSVKRDPEAIKQYLSDDEFKLYDLIWRKFLASQMTPAVDEQISISILAGDHYWFKTTGRRNIFPGFGLVLGDYQAAAKKEKEAPGEEEEEKESRFEDIPNLQAGDLLTLHELIGNQHFTKPPGRYNDASLVKTLEEQGIGRPSTYAPTIFTLLYRDYVERKGGAMLPTELGEIVADLLVKHFPKVIDVGFTAMMEEELDKVEEGELEWRRVLKDFYSPFQENLEAAKEEMKNFRREVIETEHVCELCGKNLVVKWGRFGKFLACPGFPDCKNTRSLPTGFKCPEPNCGGDLVKRKSKRRKTFYGCSNYPKCTYIANKLPKKDESVNQDDQLTSSDRESIDP